MLHSLPYLGTKHEITLIGWDSPNRADVSRYCKSVTVLPVPTRSRLELIRILTLGVLKRPPTVLEYFKSAEMQRVVDQAWKRERFDMIVIDHPHMLGFVAGKYLPIVVLECFALEQIALDTYRLENKPVSKILDFIYARQAHGYAKLYRAADALIAVSDGQRDRVLGDCQDLNIKVVPLGVDVDYYKPLDIETPYPSITITGTMSGSRNRAGVLWFYREVYPYIKESVPDVRLFLVGQNPHKDLLRLQKDNSVTVTGFVEDLRIYLGQSWVIASPLTENHGVKVRLLQAMAMGKAVVSTSMISGINVTDGKDVMIADFPSGFALHVLTLLRSRPLRERIGHNARCLMLAEHSWDKYNKEIDDILTEVRREYFDYRGRNRGRGNGKGSVIPKA